MKISTKGRYALRMFVDLASQGNQEYIALKDIASRIGVSKKYLEQIAILFNSTDYLRTNRGYRGGYMLAKPAEQYRLGDILRITEGNLCPVNCLERDPNPCERASICSTLPVWQGLYDVITAYVDNITLQDILDQASSEIPLDFQI